MTLSWKRDGLVRFERKVRKVAGFRTGDSFPQFVKISLTSFEIIAGYPKS